MAKRYVMASAVVCLLALFWVTIAAADFTVYLPFVSRMPTPTPTLLPMHYYLSGRVFFDYNGSGLQEDGEPGISGVPLELVIQGGIGEAVSASSGLDGSYRFVNLEPATYSVSVRSPTQDPKTAFGYINKWKGPVIVPEYTKDIDAAAAAGLATIPACNGSANSGALVCKLDSDTLLVREQHLQDTEIQPINQPLVYSINENKVENIALMQGILTMPILQSDWPKMTRTQAYDHDPRKDYVADYKGDTTVCEDAAAPYTDCTFDNHLGWDYGVPQGSMLVSSIYGQNQIRLISAVFIVPTPEIYIDGGNPFLSSYGHLLLTLVADQNEVYRGQVLAVSGKVGTNWDHLHFGAQYGRDPPREPDDGVSPGPIWDKDTYGVIEPIAIRFPIERFGLWTVFNDPQFVK